MGTGYKNRGSGAAGLGFKNRGAKLVDGAAYTNRGATDGVNEAFKNRGQAWGSDAYYNRGPNDFASLSVLGLAEFYAPLTHSLVLTRGTGDPTYSRATVAWEFDNEGKLILVPSGAARFGGARMVRNLIAATSTLSTQNVTTVATSYTLSFYGTGSVTLSGTATGTLNGTGASNRVQTTVTATAGTLTLTVSGSVTDAQLENVTGQADQTASEYVSVGVLSAPYHGAGVDGVKWFDTNKDGSTISESSLLGNHAEGARTNSLLYSRDLRSYYWNSVAGTGAEIRPASFYTSANWVKSAGFVVNASDFTATAAAIYSNNYWDSVPFVTAGKTYIVSGTATITSGSFKIIVASTSGPTISSTGDFSFTVVVGNAGSNFFIQPQSTLTAVISNISVKEAAIQVTTCTGLDNAAKSASTLTAGAADATILQTLTLAAAARSFSAYVKRRTGSGNIYITRDGGTSWTDVTSQINSSTWTRVKIENTSVLNPQVGFKIATSGDAIDVDVCQDEAGPFISSPIVTTTAAVTRNAEDVYYPSANIGNATGSVLFNVMMEPTTATARMLIACGTASTRRASGSAPTTINFNDSTNEIQKTGLTDMSTGSRKRAFSYTGASASITGDGAAVATGSFDGSFGANNALRIGNNGDGTSLVYGYMKDVYIWSTALTDAQLQQVTA